jgi:hypothetical protein
MAVASTSPGKSGLDVQRIRPDLYCELIVSRRALARCDDLKPGMLGLVDCSSGERYVLPERDLIEFQRQGRSNSLLAGDSRHPVCG